MNDTKLHQDNNLSSRKHSIPSNYFSIPPQYLHAFCLILQDSQHTLLPKVEKYLYKKIKVSDINIHSRLATLEDLLILCTFGTQI